MWMHLSSPQEFMYRPKKMLTRSSVQRGNPMLCILANRPPYLRAQSHGAEREGEGAGDGMDKEL